MTSVGPVGAKIAGGGVEVRSLGMHAGRPGPIGLARLARALQHYRPHVLQTWMYHADLLGAIAAKFVSARLPVICVPEPSFRREREARLTPGGAFASRVVDDALMAIPARGRRSTLG